jgi:hypothetical protein
MGYALTEDSNARTLVNSFSKWPIHRLAVDGSLYNFISYYEATFWGNTSTYISSDAQWGSLTGQGSSGPPSDNLNNKLSWTNGSTIFTWSDVLWTPTQGDPIIFECGVGTSYNMGHPGGMTCNTRTYYTCNVTGTGPYNFKLSTSPDCTSFVTPTDTNSIGGGNGYGVYAIAHTAPLTSGLSNLPGDSENYVTNALGTYSMLKAVGVTGLDSVISELKLRTGRVRYGTEDPKYALTTSF